MAATCSANATLATVSTQGQYTCTLADYGSNTFNPLAINRQQGTIGAQNVGFLAQDSNSTSNTKLQGKFSKYV